MIAELEIRMRLADVLEGSESLDSFESWLVAESWNMHLDSTPEAQALVGDIELALAEYSNGDITTGELTERLANLLRTVTVMVEIDPATSTVRQHTPAYQSVSSFENRRPPLLRLQP